MEQEIPKLRRVQRPSSFRFCMTDPEFNDTLKGYPSPFYSYYLNCIQGHKKAKYSRETLPIIRSMRKDNIYNVENTHFIELIEDYTGMDKDDNKSFKKPFLIDFTTWQSFLLPEHISEIRKEALSVKNEYQKNKSSNVVVNETRENLVFDTISPFLQINLNISTDFLKENTIHKQEGLFLMLELSYEYLKEIKQPKYPPKIRLPLDQFLSYLQDKSGQFFNLCYDSLIYRPVSIDSDNQKRKSLKKKFSEDEEDKINDNYIDSDIQKRKSLKRKISEVEEDKINVNYMNEEFEKEVRRRDTQRR